MKDANRDDSRLNVSRQEWLVVSIYTATKLFDGECGIRNPEEVVRCKVMETQRVKAFHSLSKHDLLDVLLNVESDFLAKVLTKRNVIQYIIEHASEQVILDSLLQKVNP